MYVDLILKKSMTYIMYKSPNFGENIVYVLK